MMELELGLLEKERQDPEAQLMVIYIYLLMLMLMIYLKDLMKIYFLNAQYLLQMLHLELRLRFLQLMVAKLK